MKQSGTLRSSAARKRVPHCALGTQHQGGSPAVGVPPAAMTLTASASCGTRVMVVNSPMAAGLSPRR